VTFRVRKANSPCPGNSLIATVTRLLEEIQANLLQQATDFRDANLHKAGSYDDLKEIVNEGWALIWHCGLAECENRIKEDTKATSRCFPLDLNEEWYPKGKTCTVCGKPAQGLAYFSRAY